MAQLAYGEVDDTLANFTARGHTARTPEFKAALMLSIIDSSNDVTSRRRRLQELTQDWPVPGVYRQFLQTVLSSPALPEDAKLRLLTMGRPGPANVGSFVLNRPLLAAEMLLAVAHSRAAPVIKEHRMLCLGFTGTDAIAALMRESRPVREPIIRDIERMHETAPQTLQAIPVD